MSDPRLASNTPLRILVPNLAPSSAAGNPELHLLYDAMRKLTPVEVEQFTRRAARRSRWDIIHFYWPEWAITRDRGSLLMLLDALRFFVTLRFARWRGARVVWTLHNLLPHERDRLGIIDWYTHAFSRYVDYTICSSQTLYEEFIREYPALRRVGTRIHPSSGLSDVYPDDGLSQAEARARLEIPTNATVLLSLGMIRRYKNLIHLVRCFIEAAQTRDDAFLLIAGPALDDDYATELRHELRATDRARLHLEYVQAPEIQLYLRAADRLVWPALLPGDSTTVMLALSFACPVLVPRRGPFVELEETLGAEWVQAYDGGLRPGVVARALDTPFPSHPIRLDDRYSWSAAAADYLTVYQNLSRRATQTVSCSGLER